MARAVPMGAGSIPSLPATGQTSSGHWRLSDFPNTRKAAQDTAPARTLLNAPPKTLNTLMGRVIWTAGSHVFGIMECADLHCGVFDPDWMSAHEGADRAHAESPLHNVPQTEQSSPSSAFSATSFACFMGSGNGTSPSLPSSFCNWFSTNVIGCVYFLFFFF